MSVTKTKDEITPRLNQISADLKQLPKGALEKAKQLTPRRTGNARRNTRLINNTTIVGDYEYSGALDSGASKNAPSGITKPLSVWLDTQSVKIIGGQ